MGRRRKAREYALQMLFQIDLTDAAPQLVFDQFWSNQEAEPDEREFAERLVQGVVAQRRELDRYIVGAADNWRVERMATVDRNILRVAIHELLDDEQTPPPVIIDEAIAVAKRFGSGESGSFINGVLDSIRRQMDKERLDGTGAPQP
jgi:N utilization substance protein B